MPLVTSSGFLRFRKDLQCHSVVQVLSDETGSVYNAQTKAGLPRSDSGPPI